MIYYRIRPVHAPVRHAKLESYPSYEAAMARIEELIWIIQRDHTSDAVEYAVDEMDVRSHTTLIHQVASRGWRRKYE